MNEGFWKAWDREKKRLKELEPNCTCGKKHPDKTLHDASCPYLQFWDREFLRFRKSQEGASK